MVIPEPHLLTLTELLSGKTSQDPKVPFLQGNGYKINANDWSCVLSEPGIDPWYFRPLESDLCDSKSLFGGSKTIPNPWSINQPLSEEVQKSVQGIGNGRWENDPSGNFFVIFSESFGSVLGTRCTSLQLVAKTLQTWGTPPESVIQDWQNQLEQSTLPSTAETLVTEDGILIPLPDVLNHLERGGLQGVNIVLRPLPVMAHFFSLEPQWPHCKPTVESQVDFDPVAPSISPAYSAGTLQRKRKTNSKWLPIGSVSAAITILALSIWLLSPDKKTPNERVAGLEVPKPKATSIKSMTAGTDAGTVHDATETELQELTITNDPIGFITASSIINEALSPVGMGLPTISTDVTFGGVESNETVESNEASVPAALNTVLTESGRITLERPLRIQAAITKETVSVGKPVLAKACRCEIELKLAENLIVEPMESVTIEGAGKASWRIAIEDEDPELIVEIWSKPGARWQVITTVGLLEGPGMIPIWIGPREAQNVGNRLIDYRQWIINAIETLRTARSNTRGRSSIDFAGEIKKLERQEREADKAIDRWRVIARLSHFFFDGNEVRLQFLAVEKP